MIDFVTALIHDGKGFHVKAYDAALADTDVLEVLIQVAGSALHVNISIGAEGDFEAQVFEGTTISAAGTPITPLNLNRASSKQSTGIFTTAPTITTDGVEIGHAVLPGGQRNNAIDTEVGGKGEIVLAPNTNYLIRAKNFSGSASRVSTTIIFYEPQLPPSSLALLGLLTFDLSGGLPSGFFGRNGMAFVNVDTFTQTDIPFADPFNGDKNGFWINQDVFDGRDNFDYRYTFAWDPQADGPPDIRVLPSIFDVNASVDGLSPYQFGPIIDRNNPLIFPGRFVDADNNSAGTALANVTPNFVPSGSELTADGTTLHTIGYAIKGLNYRCFFDTTEIANFELTESERAEVNGCTRVGIMYLNGDGESELHYRHSKLELGPSGSIYT